MKIIRTINAMHAQLNTIKTKQIGFVPTMGFLHEGHLSLVEEAKAENDIVVMSIFVNPLQFGPNEDFDRYPRNEEQDAKIAEETGVDILFIPDVTEMYPEEMGIKMTIDKGTNVLCGKSRPGHFDGVITVLTKLFHIVEPTKAYFGLKDAQQFSVVHTLVKELNFPVTLVGLPTVRENDGLAKSSRNVYLSPEEREQAISLYNSLKLGQKILVDGMKNPVTMIKGVRDYLTSTTTGTIDYVELLSFPNLEEVSDVKETIILAVAVQYERARLIDNIILDEFGQLIDRVN